MPEIGTSGSMSGDGKRGVAEWPKLPRPSSTLPHLPTWVMQQVVGCLGHTKRTVDAIATAAVTHRRRRGGGSFCDSTIGVPVEEWSKQRAGPHAETAVWLPLE